jgi:hypothetical protein
MYLPGAGYICRSSFCVPGAAQESFRHAAPLPIAQSPRPNLLRVMTTHTISFNPDGTALCLWIEAVSLHEIGRLEIHRATNIEFNNATQQWEVKDRKRKVRFFSRSRATWSGKNETCNRHEAHTRSQEHFLGTHTTFGSLALTALCVVGGSIRQPPIHGISLPMDSVERRE